MYGSQYEMKGITWRRFDKFWVHSHLHLLLMLIHLWWATDLLNLFKRRKIMMFMISSLNGNMLHLHSSNTITFNRPFTVILKKYFSYFTYCSFQNQKNKSNFLTFLFIYVTRYSLQIFPILTKNTKSSKNKKSECCDNLRTWKTCSDIA